MRFHNLPHSKPSCQLFLLAGFLASTSTLMASQLHVSNASALMNATKSAVAGDTILIAPGTYTGSTSQSGDPGNLPNGTGYFWVGNNGTAQHPIVLVAQDPSLPPLLQGTSVSTGYVVHVTGDHVVLKNLRLSTGDKVVVFDNASHAILEDCEVTNAGAELIHVRDSSSDVLIRRNHIHNSGKTTPNYGEGIYVGTDQARWGASDIDSTGTVAPWWGDKAVSEGYGGYDWRVHHTEIDCNLLEDIAAEPLDIKEGTQWTTVTRNVFMGDSIGRKGGTAYYSYVGSFIDQKGVKSTMAGNTFYDGNNPVDSNSSTGMSAYCAEVKRTFAHVPSSLTPAANSGPWFDAKASVDSNDCALANNTVTKTVPADPRWSCTSPAFDFHSPVYQTPAGVAKPSRHRMANKNRLVIDSEVRGLSILTNSGRRVSILGK